MPQIFLDSANPEDTRVTLEMALLLVGQTTNPTLVGKNLEVQERILAQGKMTEKDLWQEYKKIAQEISEVLPQGAISLEVYADLASTTEELVKQGEELNSWIPNAYIKLPIIPSGMSAGFELIKKGINVNMTLCFIEEQAAAVLGMAREAQAKDGQVLISPFVGRLDERGIDGASLVANIMRLYRENGDSRVKVVAASIRSAERLAEVLECQPDFVSARLSVLSEWYAQYRNGIGHKNNVSKSSISADLQPISYKKISIDKDVDSWHNIDINNDLTTAGLEKFVIDWNSLILNKKMTSPKDINELNEEELEQMMYEVGVYIGKLVQNSGFPEDVQLAMVALMQDMSLEELLKLGEVLEERVMTGVPVDLEFIEKCLNLRKEYDQMKKEQEDKILKELDEVEAMIKQKDK